MTPGNNQGWNERTRRNRKDVWEVEGEKRRAPTEEEPERTASGDAITTADGNQLAILVAASEQSPSWEPTIVPGATAKILTGVYDDSGVVPVGVADVSLDVTVIRPDGYQESFSVTTDADGSAAVTYDLSDSDRGNGTYEATVTDGDGTNVTTQWDVGLDFLPTSEFSDHVFVGEEVQFNFIAVAGGEGVANKELTLRMVDSDTDETVVETATSTDADGFAGVAATPSSPGRYRFEADRNGSTVATEPVDAVDIIGGGDYDLRSALVGETNSYGGYLYSTDGIVPNFDFTIAFYKDYSREDLLVEKSVTTDGHGFFFFDYDIPDSLDTSSLYLSAEAANGQQIGLEFDYIWVDDPGSGGGSTVQLSVSTDSYRYTPGDDVVVEIEALDDGDPIAEQSVDVFLRYDYSGPPLYSTTVTTDGEGRATTSTTIPADTPDGIDLDGSGGMEYDGSTYTDSIFGDIQIYDYGFNYPDLTPGEAVTYSIEVTNTSTGDPIEGVPFQFDAIYDNGRAGSFGRAKLVSGSDGTDETSIQIPTDLGFDALANDINRYDDESIAAVTDPVYPGSLSTEDTLVPGESAEFNFTVPNDVTLSGIAFGDYPADKTFGTQFQGPGTFSLQVPSSIDTGDYLLLTVWAIDDQGEKYRDYGWFEVTGESISVDATGETGVSVGGEATMSISASQVDQLIVDKVWTDWDLAGSNPDGGTVTEQIVDAGNVTIEYDSIQSSVSPSLTLSLDSRYVGGTYVLVVSASNSNGGSAETTAIITIG